MGGCKGWGALSMLGEGGALSALMGVCLNSGALGMGEHGGKGALSPFRVGGHELSGSGVSE